MRAIKALTVLAVLATLAWGGYWFAGARALDRALTEILSTQTRFGMDGHQILGFPNRFDVTLDQPRLAFEGGDWSADFVQVFALSYRLNHWLAVVSPEQRLRLAGESLSINATDLRLSVELEAGLDLPLDRVALVGEGLSIRHADATHRLDRLRIASRRIAPEVQELALVVEDLQPDPALMDRIDPLGHLPRHLRVLRLDAEAQTDRPLDRHSLTGQPPGRVQLTLTGARLAWVDSDIALTGRLTPDARGLMSGAVELRIDGWPALLARARATGMLEPGQTGPLDALLSALPTDHGGDSIEVPLSVVSGDVWLGPILLLTLPPLP